MNMKEELKQYHESVDITPVDKMRTYNEMFSTFDCGKKDDCRAICKKSWCKNPKGDEFLFSPPIKGEGDIHLSQYYQDGWYQGIKIPRIVVLSLSRPQPEPGEDRLPPNNTSQAQSQGSGGDRNEHWPRTLLTVRSLLYPSISIKNKSDEEIEQLFVHVRTAKCCSNAGGGRQEDGKVYANCGVYLPGELSILKPDVIVTQGAHARDATQNRAFNNVDPIVTKIKVSCIPSRIVTLKENNQSTYWLPMIFPTETFGHMKTWDEQAGEESNGVRKNLVHYGEKIKEFIENR